MSKEIKTLDLGWAMCRLTIQDFYPKIKLEILSPSTESEHGFMPAQDICISEEYLIRLRDMLKESI